MHLSVSRNRYAVHDSAVSGLQHNIVACGNYDIRIHRQLAQPNVPFTGISPFIICHYGKSFPCMGVPFQVNIAVLAGYCQILPGCFFSVQGNVAVFGGNIRVLPGRQRLTGRSRNVTGSRGNDMQILPGSNVVFQRNNAADRLYAHVLPGLHSFFICHGAGSGCLLRHRPVSGQGAFCQNVALLPEGNGTGLSVLARLGRNSRGHR